MPDPQKTRIKPAHLQALSAVAHYGSFGEAALELDLSQSAVSYAIAALEEELGIILLHRSRNGATLTPAGESVHALAKQVLGLLDEIVQVSTDHRGLQRGRVRVGVFRSVGTYVLPGAIAQFQTQFPNIAVTITEFADSKTVKLALKDQTIDIGFTDELCQDADIDRRELFKDEYVVLLPPGTDQHGKTLSWSEISAYPLLFEAPGSVWYTRLQDYLKSCGAVLPVAHEIREDSTRVNMVAQGLGATIIPQLAAEPIPVGVQVCRLPVPFERSIGVATLATAMHPPAVFALLDVLLENR